MAPNARIFAIKKVSLRGLNAEIRAGFHKEVELLRMLRGKSGVIQLVDSEECKEQELLYVVLEYGEIDLSKLLERKRKQWHGRDPFVVDAQFMGAVWRDMLRAVGVRTNHVPTLLTLPSRRIFDGSCCFTGYTALAVGRYLWPVVLGI